MPAYIEHGGPSATPRRRMTLRADHTQPTSGWLLVTDGYAAADAIPARWLVVEAGGVREASANEKAAQLDAYRAERVATLVAEVNAYGTAQGYDADTEHRLAVRREEAARLGLVNRAAHIQTAIDWRESVMAHYGAARAALAAAATVAAVDAVTWDFSQFTASNPGVSVTSALAIAD